MQGLRNGVRKMSVSREKKKQTNGMHGGHGPGPRWAQRLELITCSFSLSLTRVSNNTRTVVLSPKSRSYYNFKVM